MTVSLNHFSDQNIAPFVYLPRLAPSDLEDNGFQLREIVDDDLGPLLYAAKTIRDIAGTAIWEHYLRDDRPGFTLSLSRDANRKIARAWIEHLLPEKVSDAEWLKRSSLDTSRGPNPSTPRVHPAKAAAPSQEAIISTLVNEVAHRAHINRSKATDVVNVIFAALQREAQAGNPGPIAGINFEAGIAGRSPNVRRRQAKRVRRTNPAQKLIETPPGLGKKVKLATRVRGPT